MESNEADRTKKRELWEGRWWKLLLFLKAKFIYSHF